MAESPGLKKIEPQFQTHKWWTNNFPPNQNHGHCSEQEEMDDIRMPRTMLGSLATLIEDMQRDIDSLKSSAEEHRRFVEFQMQLNDLVSKALRLLGPQPQPVVAAAQPQPVVAAAQPQPIAAAAQPQPEVARLIRLMLSQPPAVPPVPPAVPPVPPVVSLPPVVAQLAPELCLICQENLTINGTETGHCGHCFHRACITQWTRGTCPTCRERWVPF